MEDSQIRELKSELITAIASLVFQIVHHVVYLCSVFQTDGVGDFNETVVFEQYPTEMTPNSWGSTIWQTSLALQYSWLSAMVIYFVGCKEDEIAQKRLFWARILFCIGSFFNTLRVALFAYAQLTASFVMALLATVAMVPSAQLLTALPRVVAPGECDDFAMKVFYYFSNFSISVLAGWTGFYMLILLAMTLVYESPIEATSEAASTACLTIFLMAFFLNMVLHLCPMERMNRHQMGTQVIMILAAGCIYTNLEKETTNGRLCLSILVLTSIGLLVKAVLGVIWDKMERDTSIETLPVLAT